MYIIKKQVVCFCLEKVYNPRCPFWTAQLAKAALKFWPMLYSIFCNIIVITIVLLYDKKYSFNLIRDIRVYRRIIESRCQFSKAKYKVIS